MPEKVLIEKGPSGVGFEGVSQLSCEQENALKVKVRNGFNITHGQAREQGPLGEPQGHRTPEGGAVRWVTPLKEHIYVMTGILSFPKGQ